MWVVITIFFLVFILIKPAFQRSPTYPPGPPLFPLVGNIVSAWYNHKKLKYRHKVWQAWARKYGNLLGLKLGSINVVVVSGKEYIKEVSSREVFEGRPDGFFYLMRSFGKKLGIVFSDGPFWNKTRRAVLRYLKNYGYGSKSMEAHINEECQALVTLLDKRMGKAVCVNRLFDVCVVNIVWRLVAGKRYDLTDKRLKNLCDLITRTFKIVDMSGGLLNFLPFLRHVMPNFIGYTELKNLNDSIHAFLKETIDEHRQKLDVKNPRDVIDALLIEISNQEDKTLSDEELQVLCLDLLEAGVETVSNTAVFLLLYVVRDKEVQARLHREIDKEIGHCRPPTLSDRSRLIYTEAVLLETLRISTIAAMGIPHMALEDARLGKYIIPKVFSSAAQVLPPSLLKFHSYVIDNYTCAHPCEINEEAAMMSTVYIDNSSLFNEFKLYGVILRHALCKSSPEQPGESLSTHALKLANASGGTFLLLAFYDLHNGSHWKDASTFKPERFLTKDGNLIQDEWLMPFGTGRRRCIGEGLARCELFLFLTHILQKFRLKVPDGEPIPSADPEDGVTLSAKEFHVVFEPRF